MEKTELLFRMMEQPEKYDDEQWREILQDKECRELYTMMSATRSALDAERYDQQADEAAPQQEWQRLAARHPQRMSTWPLWHRIAAAIAGIIIAAGIVVAAVHTSGFGLLQGNYDSNPSTQQAPVTASMDVPRDDAMTQEETPTLHGEAHLYDNIALEQIIDDMATRYNIQEVEWQSQEARSLRLYYRWEPSYSIDKVVDMLNSFQAFTIKHTGNKLIISDISGNQ